MPIGKMESSRQALNPMLEPRKHERHETDRGVSADDADYTDVRDSGTESAESVDFHSGSASFGFVFSWPSISESVPEWLELKGPPDRPARGGRKQRTPEPILKPRGKRETADERR
jgi:hypothetical protein